MFNAEAARSYIDGPKRQVPGFEALHRMMSMLLAESAPEDARVLVLGAGGGLELKTLADDHGAWTFDGVDPSRDMLELAQQIIAPHGQRVKLHQGYISEAPEGPFDAATCLLTLHFVPREQRLATLTQVRMRLKSGAPFVLAHISFSQDEPERSRWISRHVAFSGLHTANLERAKEAIRTKLTILAPDEEEDMLRQAGFVDVSLFYTGLTFRGWMAYAR